MSLFVKDFYNRNANQEWERLETPRGKIELASTLRLMDRYFPKQGHLLDIGGGPGRYTIELIQRGYQVTLLDLSEEEIALAHTRLDQLGLQAEELVVGDARELSQMTSGSFEAALLMGPMYHLIKPEERAGVLRELARILKPLGVAVIAYLNSWGLLRTGITDFPEWYQDLARLRAMLTEQTFPGQTLSDFT